MKTRVPSEIQRIDVYDVPRPRLRPSEVQPRGVDEPDPDAERAANVGTVAPRAWVMGWPR
ncbi:MAG: hypothetical protein K0V04_18700 [Deltaproteobacteria bacterium]|nr:hypothetical protein [Deltaproteobacteria bacterium]